MPPQEKRASFTQPVFLFQIRPGLVHITLDLFLQPSLRHYTVILKSMAHVQNMRCYKSHFNKLLCPCFKLTEIDLSNQPFLAHVTGETL